jgi:hypothetical protein
VWQLAASWDSSGTGFVSEIDARPCEPRRSCVHAHPVRGEPPDLRPWIGTLGGGVTAYVPIALATQDGKTIPHAAALLPRGDDAVVATDRATRLTAVIIGWNVFEHFYPYFDVAGTEWMAELPARLREAAIAAGPAAMLATLRHMVHDLRDGHGSVSVEHRPPSGAEVAPGIRYVDLDTATAEEWSKILPDLATAKAVVCDMRGYPRFSVTEPLAHFTRKKIRSARWNIPNPARPDREGMTFVASDWSVAPRAPFIDHVCFRPTGAP